MGLSTRSLLFFQTSKGEHHLGSVYFLHSLHPERIRPCTQIEPPPHSLHRERRRPCTQIDAPPHSLHTEPTACTLALRALTAVHADSPPAALLALRALTAVHADLRPAALLAPRVPTSVGTSAAHLAFRPILHPVLAWPLRGRGSLPLRPLLRRILLLISALRSLHLGDAGAQPAEVGSPNRRHLPCEILGLFVFLVVVRGRFDVDGGGLVVVVVGLFLDDDGISAQEDRAPGGGHGARRYEL